MRNVRLYLNFALLVCGAALVEPAGAQWDIECDPDAIPEGEPDCGFPEDTVDGGCMSDPPVFWPIECGQVICGTSKRSWGYADYDWYEIQFTEPAVITWTVIAEFYPRITIRDGTGGCEDYFTIAYTGGEPAVPTTLAAVVEPGTYWLLVRPLPSYYFECGGEYQAELSCQPVIYGSCCLADGTCQELPAVTCASEGGLYFGDGSNCSDSVCPAGPGACCLADGNCADELVQVECESLAGIFYGGGSQCEEVDCCFYPEGPFDAEGEPICYDGYLDDYNGGCDPAGYPYYAQWIDCGDVLVGHSGTYLDPDGWPRRDMDLYELLFPLWSPTTRYTWRVTAAFPAEIGFVEGSSWGPFCDWWYETTASAGACQTAIIDVGVSYIYDVYWGLYVRPQAGADVPCGTPYVAELSCEPLEEGCQYQRRGDANCDNAVNFFDIDAFVLALLDPAAWEAAYGGEAPWYPGPDCGYLCLNDCNGDGLVNFFDIDPFVALITGGG